MDPEDLGCAQELPSQKMSAQSYVDDNDDIDSFAHYYFKAEFRDKLVRDIPVEEFMQSVWNFNPKDTACGGRFNRTKLFGDRSHAKEGQLGTMGDPAVHVRHAPLPSFIWSTVPRPADADSQLIYSELNMDDDMSEEESEPDFYEEEYRPYMYLRKRDAFIAGFSDADGPPSKKARTKLTTHEARTSENMNGILSSGVRSYASGFVMDRDDMHMWYGDRLGLVKSASFKWKMDTKLLALVLSAIGQADFARLGVLWCYPRRRFATDDTLAALDDDAGFGTMPSELLFDVDTTRETWTASGAVGRGTTIVPVKATGMAAKLFGTEDLVAKMAWPQQTRTRESTFVRLSRAALKKSQASMYLEHVVDVKCSLNRSMEQMKLPRVFMDATAPDEDDAREFRMTIMRNYQELNAVENTEQFTKVFVDVVRAHHWVWVSAGILHSDISVNNVMFYMDKDGRPMGVLCDWDMAQKQPSDEAYAKDDARILHINGEIAGPTSESVDVEDGRPRCRTGTLPFIAFDLLEQSPPPLTATTTSSNRSSTCSSTSAQHLIQQSTHTTDFGQTVIGRSLITQKGVFLRFGGVEKTFAAHGHPDYKPLVKKWILRHLFSRFYREGDYISESVVPVKDSTAKQDLRDFELQVHEIKERQKAWHETITYKTFMGTLGLDPHLHGDPECRACLTEI